MIGWIGGNRTGELSKKEYIDRITKMTGMRNTVLFRKLNKNEIKTLALMIESAIYKAIDEYKRGLTKNEF